MKRNQIIYIIGFVVVIGDLLGRVIQSEVLDFIFKPLLMPLLLLYFWINSTHQQNISFKLLVFALIFSWLGDVFLMFTEVTQLFFVLGLSSFLLAHVFYVITFYFSVKNSSSQGKGYLFTNPIWVIPFLAYGVGFFAITFPYLEEMKVPVLVYAIVITSMGFFALNRKNSVPDLSFNWVMIGAILFMISDSCIGINKFLFSNTLTWMPFLIMVTYILGQVMIIRGCLLESIKN